MTEGPADDSTLASQLAIPSGPLPDRLSTARPSSRKGLRLSPRAQILATGVAVVALGWAAYASLALVAVSRDRQVTTLELDAGRTVTEALQDRLADAQAEAAELQARLEQAEAGGDALAAELAQARETADQAMAKRDALLAEQALLAAQRDALANERDALADRNRALQDELVDSGARQGELEQAFDSLRDQVAAAVARAEDSLRQRDQLESQVGSLQALIDEMRDQQREIVDRVAGRTVASISDLETLVADTGLDVGLLVDRAEGVEGGQGGPFIPADALLATDAAYELQVSVAMLDSRLDRWDALQRIAQVLPLSAPLEHYEITSGFGYRRDPINGRDALHTGVDFAAPRKTPLLATGPGIVTFAGWRGQYGRVVEIDHGFGIKTRFAHMSKILVKKGQVVAVGDEVGELGSSGRVTGPHLHYEVLFDNKPYDPMKFLAAAKHD